jgi:predicted nucleic acid-binding protein
VYLVDTSIWIDYLRASDNKAIRQFTEVLAHGYPYGITSVIYQEILQGADTTKDFDRLEQYLITQRFYQPRDALASYREAAGLFFRCRRQGVTVRSTIDCLIAQIAIEHELLLLHNDRDFDRMARVIPQLRLA